MSCSESEIHFLQRTLYQSCYAICGFLSFLFKWLKTVWQRTLWWHSGVALSRKKPTGHTALAASCAVPVEGGGGGRPVGAA